MSYHPSRDDIDYAAFAIPSGTPDRHPAVQVEHDLRAPMHDGVELGADLYRPQGAGAFPTVAIRMPYGKQTPEMGMRQVGEWLARKGYACLVQDVRGKFSSGGVFDPGVNEVEDGKATVEWITRQPWSDGRVGLWGESYYGFTSFAAAVSGHFVVRNARLRTNLRRSEEVAAERAQAWDFVQNVLDSLPVGVVLIDAETRRVRDVNPAAAQMIGRPAEAVTGRVCHDFICPNRTGACPVLDDHQDIDHSERVLLRADGGETPVLKTAVPMEVAGRAYLLETFLDISDRKRAEAER